MAAFDLVTIAVDNYPDPPGRLGASEVAERFASVLHRLGGVNAGSSATIASSKGDIEKELRTWAKSSTGPRCSIVYLVGHGEGNSMVHSFLTPDPSAPTDVIPFETRSLAQYLRTEWQVRQSDPAAWSLFILDCCDSDLGMTNIAHELEGIPVMRPRELALWPVNVEGATRLSAFVDAFERAVDGFTENDDEIHLDEIFRRIKPQLGDLTSRYPLPASALWPNPKKANAGIMLPLDTYGELQAAISKHEGAFRNHFLNKAQGAESGELAWFFVGRQVEIETIATWLSAPTPGMLVVTGDAGSGKSALVGHIAVLADYGLVDAYVTSGLAPRLGDGPRPPDQCFDVLIHLTGKTVHDVQVELLAPLLDAAWKETTSYKERLPSLSGEEFADLRDSYLASYLEGFNDEGAVAFLIDERTGSGAQRPFTVLLDALDEAQEPEVIASYLAGLCDGHANVQLLIGTRRSTEEGPDTPPDKTVRGLLDHLGVIDAHLIDLERDPFAVREFAYRRLVETSYSNAQAADLANRIAAAEEHLLFARLATAELTVMAPTPPSDAELDLMLSGGHRGLFGAVVQRFRDTDEPVAVLLQGLALTRGRGLPRDRGVWLLVAQTVGDPLGIAVTESDLERALAAAAPYITLDAEGGLSVYRLAHQTFVEFFHAELGQRQGHDRIAEALATGVWMTANYYQTRYVIEHATLAAENQGDASVAAGLATDPAWLRRAANLLGVDTVVDVLSTAARRVRATGLDDQLTRRLDTVSRAIRRSRVSLAVAPECLGPMLHTRLWAEHDEQLQTLGRSIAEQDANPWLRMTAGALGWSTDLNASYTAPGHVRALAFSQLGGVPTVAIGADNHVELWDPRTAGPSRSFALDHRVTALGLGDADGQPVVAVAASYDGTMQVFDPDGGPMSAVFDLDPSAYTDSVAVGLVEGEPHVAAVGTQTDSLRLWRLHDGQPYDVPTLGVGQLKGVSTVDGQLVVHILRAIPDGATADIEVESHGLALPDLAVAWTAPMSSPLGQVVTLIDVNRIGDDVVAIAAVADHAQIWNVDSSEPLKWDSAISDEPRGGLRCVAIGTVGDQGVAITSAHDSCVVQVIEAHKDDQGSWVMPQVGGHIHFDSLGKSQAHDLLPPAEQVDSFSMQQLDQWPRSASDVVTTNSGSHAVTGSVAGAAIVWDLSQDPAQVIAGPFTEVAADLLADAQFLTMAKAAPRSTRDVAIAQFPDHGLVIAVAHDGSVRLIQVESGEAIPYTGSDLGNVVTVALGQLSGRAVLAAGTTEGTVTVVEVGARHGMQVQLPVDSPVAALGIDAGRNVLIVRTDSGAYELELTTPAGSAVDSDG